MATIGRPTTYDPVVNQKADEYLASCGREATKLPKITEFYRMIGISRQCGDEWQSKYPEFGDTCKKIMELQQEELIDDGLFGGKEVNPGMAIFLLKANHGMIETNRTEVGGVQNGQPIKLFVNAGQGFIPATVQIPSSSASSAPAIESPVQSTDLASQSLENNNSNNGNSQAGTS